jgi:putative oxidoreductase
MLIARIQDGVQGIADKLTWLPPLAARIALGVTFIQTGWGKLHSLDQVTEYFTKLGIPAASIQAPMVAGIEFIGGLLLIVGLFTRYASALLMSTMVVAIITAKWPDSEGALLGRLGDMLGTPEFAYLALFLWLAVAGAGKLSLDHVLAPMFRRGAGAPAATTR